MSNMFSKSLLREHNVRLIRTKQYDHDILANVSNQDESLIYVFDPIFIFHYKNDETDTPKIAVSALSEFAAQNTQYQFANEDVDFIVPPSKAALNVYLQYILRKRAEIFNKQEDRSLN